MGVHRIFFPSQKHILCLAVTSLLLLATMSSEIVDALDKVQKMIRVIEENQRQPLLPFNNLEGVTLSHHSSITIMQTLVPLLKKVCLLDVHTLQALALTTSGGSTCMTLKNTQDFDKYAKVLFNVRSDFDALHAHCPIKLRGVVDTQVMEFATRIPYRGYPCELDPHRLAASRTRPKNIFVYPQFGCSFWYLGCCDVGWQAGEVLKRCAGNYTTQTLGTHSACCPVGKYPAVYSKKPRPLSTLDVR
jgi:hypothetical protein